MVSPKGAFAVTGVPPGTWQVFCQPAPRTHLTLQTYNAKSGFSLTGTPILVKPGAVVAGINFHLDPAGLLTVTLLDAKGKPVAGARVLSFFLNSTALTTGTRPPPLTAAGGKATLANVPLKSQLAIVTADGLWSWWDGAPSQRHSQAVVIPKQGDLVDLVVRQKR
jgi:hypothetical protein